MLADVKIYMNASEDINHPLNISIDDIMGTRINQGGSWMTKAETNMKKVTNIDEIPRRAE